MALAEEAGFILASKNKGRFEKVGRFSMLANQGSSTTDKKSKSSLRLPTFPIGESLIFNQPRRRTRRKASDNRGPSLAAIPSDDGHDLHAATLPMGFPTRISGWLL